ncbi:MAG: hypothetical protein ACE15C_06980 [Phycisphaerae bacterium]
MVTRLSCVAAVAAFVMALPVSMVLGQGPSAPGTVCHVKVVSDKVLDVSSLEAWKKSFIEPAKTNQDKAIAIWRSVITYQYQDGPSPNEFLHQEDAVYDPIKMFNVYGYGICSLHSAHMDGLSRALGYPSRGWAINAHSVCEMNYDGSWHHFDSSLMHYFLRPDGSVAGIEDVFAAVKEWYDKHPDYVGIDAKERDKKLREFEFRNGRTGWKEGPALLASSPQLNAKGWWPAGTHGWYATMQEFDGTAGGKQKAYIYEYSPSMGYEVNIQLRKGERLTRNWGNTGLYVTKDIGEGKAPGCMEDKQGFLKNNQAFCDKLDPAHPNLTNGRIGNGRHEYNVPMDDKELAATALTYDNLAVKSGRLGPKDESKPGILVIRMPSSYVFLGGEVALQGNASAQAPIKVTLSDNNGLDWKEVATVTSAEAQKIDLKKFILRRYDFRLKFELAKGSDIQSLAIGCDIQHSQRPLPALDKGDNKITFSAGPQTSTITYEANNKSTHGGKQVAYTDYHPILDNLKADGLTVQGKEGKLTIPVAVPGEMTGLRFGCCYRTWGDSDSWEFQASFDDGKTFRKIADAPAQKFGCSSWCEVKDIPAGTKAALVRYIGKSPSSNMMYSFRIDADYKTPNFGFRPVKVTYLWDEGGVEKKDEHVAAKADDTWTIKCEGKPRMKSIILELAGQ